MSTVHWGCRARWRGLSARSALLRSVMLRMMTERHPRLAGRMRLVCSDWGPARSLASIRCKQHDAAGLLTREMAHLNPFSAVWL